MTKYFKKHWPLIGIGVLLIVVSIYFFKSQTATVRELILTNVDSKEGLKLENIHYTHTDPDAGIQWSLDATEARFSKDRRFVSFRNFRLRFEAENRPSMELEGKSGDYDKESEEIDLRGDVKGFTATGYSILTDQLLYKQREDCLETKKMVKISGPFFSIEGQGLYVDLRMENLKIISDVTTRINEGSLVL